MKASNAITRKEIEEPEAKSQRRGINPEDRGANGEAEQQVGMVWLGGGRGPPLREIVAQASS
jgi:hypothetical protein